MTASNAHRQRHEGHTIETPTPSPMPNPSGSERFRAFLGLILLLSAAILCAYVTRVQTESHPHESDESVARCADTDTSRFASVKPFLPPEGLVGYREDPPAASRFGVDYRFAQYVLTPVELNQDATGPFILVNGQPDRMPEVESEGRPVVLVHDAGNGVRLFRIEER
jgi:hypothetical protein